ncbi:Voltage-dependent anion channel [Roseovarius litoreus]|uniref:Voltage-dependent anion channel n=2 Tax=Roseovarius litoreus TaxID=1155722 RepID=A0A1M7LGS9_9RHOB|nr:Voltage-dependent anion channel [Roseovarius litoreus]
MPASRLAHFPIAFFVATMGLFSLALATRAGGYGMAALILTGALAVVLLGLFTLHRLKAVRYPRQVAAEWNHPVKLLFFPAANIAILLWSLLLQDSVSGLSQDL